MSDPHTFIISHCLSLQITGKEKNIPDRIE